MIMKSNLFRTVVIALAVLLPTGVSGSEVTVITSEARALAEMHNLMIMMNHGFVTVMDGWNLVMISEMSTSPDWDGMTRQHGYSMIEKGKDIIQKVPTEEEMIEMHRQGYRNFRLMRIIHDLGKAMTDEISLVEKKEMTPPHNPDTMAIHQIHILFNHALRMAVEGTNMVLLGKKEIACDVNDFTVNKGRIMMIDSRTLINEIRDGDRMQALHTRGLKPEDNPYMDIVYARLDNSARILELLFRSVSDEEDPTRPTVGDPESR